MQKRLLQDTEYTITSTNTIVVDDSISFEHKNLLLIIVAAGNKIVFNFACEDLRCTVSKQTITLLDAVVATTDELTITLTFEEASGLEELKDISLWNNRQESLLEEMLEEQKTTNKILKKIYNPE